VIRTRRLKFDQCKAREVAEELTKTLVTKGEFAKLKNRSPAAVSHWIEDGRISAAALIGQGQRAKIWVEQAEADLARNLDVEQQDRQAAPVLPVAVASVPIGQDDISRRRKADADAAELAAEERRRKLAADSGRWIEADAARKEWAQELTRIVSDMEIFVTNTLAVEIAGQFGLDGKAVAVAMRDQFRAYREAVADTAGAKVEERQAELAEAA
jgi:hypothetical protein